VPVLIASLCNPAKAKRFFHPWKVFTYTIAALLAVNVVAERYLWEGLRFTHRHDTFRRFVHWPLGAVWCFPFVAAAAAFLASRHDRGAGPGHTTSPTHGTS
jgi:hypothetical protein